MTDCARVTPDRLLALFAASNLDGVIDASFGALQAVVCCDFASAFYRSGGGGLMKERDSRGRESSPEFMRRYAQLTPAIPAVLANPGVKIVCTRASLPSSDAQVRASAFYREVMQPQGWRHAVALCFWAEPREQMPVFVASVNRGEGRPDFSEHDIACLEWIHRFIECAVHRVHEREAAKTMHDGMAIAVSDGARGFAMLDRNLRNVQSSAIGRDLCAAWEVNGGATRAGSVAGEWRLPAELSAQCKEMYAEWQLDVGRDPDSSGFRPRRRVLHPQTAGLAASITMVCPEAAGIGEPAFLVEFERRVHGVVLEPPNRTLTVLQKMTSSERAVAMVAADGLSNQEIADQLGKTVHAVKFLLHRIYQKTGLPGRAALVAVLRSN